MAQSENRNEQRGLSQRPQHDQRQTQNVTAPALRPQASPQGSIVEPAPTEQNQGLRLAQALGAATEGIQKSMPYFEQYAEKQYEKGQMDYLKGEDSPQSESYWRVKAFEQTKGENIAREDYQQELKTYYQDNRDADPQEFQEGLKKLTEEYMEGHTENWIAGFAPVAHQAEQKVLNQFQNSIIEQQAEEERKELRSLIRGETNEAINGLVDAEYDDISNVEELLNEDTMNYKTFFKQESNKERLNNRLHEVLKAAQDRGEAFGMEKQEVSDMFIDYTIRTAMEEGVPEILDVLYKEDEDGIALVDTKRVDDIEQARVRTEENMEQRIEAARKQAEKEREERAEARRKRLEEEREKERDELYKTSYQAILDLELLAQENPEEARNKAKDLRSENIEAWGELSKEDFEELTDGVQEIIKMSSGGTDEKEDDPEIVASYKSSLVREEPIDVSEAREDWRNGNMTDSTLQQLIVDNSQLEQKLEEDGEDRKTEDFHRIIRNSTDFVVEKVNDSGVYDDQKLAHSIEESIYDSLREYRDNNNGENPDLDTFINDMVNPVLKARNVTYDDVLTYSSKNEDLAKEAEQGDKTIETLNELGDEGAFGELREAQEKAESEDRIGEFGRSIVGAVGGPTSYNDAFDRQLASYGISDDDKVIRDNIKFFDAVPPKKLFGFIKTAINEKDVSLNKVFKDIDNIEDSKLVGDNDIELSDNAKTLIKTGVIAQGIVQPLFNEKVAGKNAAQVPNFKELKESLIKRMDAHGLDTEEQSIATSYMTELWYEATGRNK